jgi:hypothetical protein
MRAAILILLMGAGLLGEFAALSPLAKLAGELRQAYFQSIGWGDLIR